MKLIKRKRNLFVILVFVLLGVLLTSTKIDKQVEFVDKNLELSLRKQLGYANKPFYRSQLLDITELDLSSDEIKNIEGIQYFRNLRSLNLRNNNITDISPLSTLTNLRILDLGYNHLVDLEKANFQQLKNIKIEELNLDHNVILDGEEVKIRLSDIDSLADFSSLRVLSLVDNRIKDLTPLAKLSELKELNLRENKLDDLTGIEGLINLESLNLRENKLSDISKISNNKNLRYLNLHSNTGVNDLTPIADLIELEELILRNIPIGDQLNVLSGMTNLWRLNLRNCSVKDVELLAKLGNLKHLNLRENNLRDIHYLSELSKFEVLNLRDNHITDISSIENHKNLRYLNLHSNSDIDDITPISGLIKLEELILRNVPVNNQMNVLSGMTNLWRLNLRNCEVSDLSVLFDLMRAGALQDRTDEGIFAYLDIMENPIPNDPNHLRGFRPFWDNIRTVYPFVLNDSILNPPEFSVNSGFYKEAFLLDLFSDEEGVNIHYTLDGSSPTIYSPIFNASIGIKAGEVDENGMMKGTVVRARLYQDNGFDASPTITHTYFVSENSHEIFLLPVVSLVADPDYFFDEEIGIYQNYMERGKKWERPVELTFFNENKEFSFSQEALVRINGTGSRVFPQKSLRIFGNNNYDTPEYFNFEFFPNLESKNSNNPIKKFQTFLFRNSGHDFLKTHFKDALVQSLVKHTELDIQAYRPVNVFINGQYWGILNIRERFDEYYFENHYSISPIDVTIIKNPDDEFFEQNIIENEYLQLIEFIKNNSMQKENNINEIRTKIDLCNFIDNQIVYIYSANHDWGENNVSLWKKNTNNFHLSTQHGHDGLWRWMVVDMDVAFISANFNLLKLASGWSNHTIILNKLLENNNFKEEFINRFADHLNSTFLPIRVNKKINEFTKLIEHDMEYQIARWEGSWGNTVGSIDQWYENVNNLKIFAKQRPDYVRQHIMEEFDIDGFYTLNVKTNPEQGFVQVNSIDIITSTPGIEDPSDWSGIYFNDIPITLTAIPMTGFDFSHWENKEGEVFSYETAITFSSNADINIKAIFCSELD